MLHSLVVVRDVADGDVLARDRVAVLVLQVQRVRDLVMEPGEVGAGPEPDDQVGCFGHPSLRDLESGRSVAFEQRAARGEGGLVRTEQEIHRPAADPDDVRVDRRAARHRRLPEERVEVRRGDQGHGLAHRVVEPLRGHLVDEDLVDAARIREPAVDDERPCQRAVEVGVVGRQGGGFLDALDADRRKVELSGVDDLRQPLHLAVVRILVADLGSEDHRTGRSRGHPVPRVRRLRALRSRDRGGRDPARDAGQQPERDERSPT